MNFECVQNICNNVLIALYLKKRDTDKFYVGLPISVDLSHLKVMLLDSDGTPDGFAVCSLDSIYRIEFNSIYLKSLTKKVEIPFCAYNFCNADIYDFLYFSRVNRKLIRLYDHNMNTIMFGIPISYDSDNITIQRICINGKKGKIKEVNINDIAVYMYDSKDELNLYKKYLRKSND